MTETQHYPRTSVKPPRFWDWVDVFDLWHYRDLFTEFAGKDIKLRYKQTVLGALWAVLQPFLMMVVFTLVFSRIAGLPSQGIPYPVFNYAALLPWTLCSQGVIRASESLVGNMLLLTKVYFPRLVLPTSAVAGCLIDFLLASIVLAGLMAYYRVVPNGAYVLLLPVFLVLVLVTTLGVGLWLSALNALYRDVRYVVPFATQLWLFATPVVYPASSLPASLRIWYPLNPMVGAVEGFRWSLLGTPAPTLWTMVASTGMAVIILLTGLMYFRVVEQKVADVI